MKPNTQKIVEEINSYTLQGIQVLQKRIKNVKNF